MCVLVFISTKINFVKYTKDCFPNYTYYSWVDFGCIREIPENIPNNINVTFVIIASIMYGNSTLEFPFELNFLKPSPSLPKLTPTKKNS